MPDGDRCAGAERLGGAVSLKKDGKTRSAPGFLSKRGDEAETYRISLAYYDMDEDGRLIRSDSTAT